VDRDFKYILQQSLDSKVLQFLKINNIKHLLESMLNLLATTKKSLNDFLEVNKCVLICLNNYKCSELCIILLFNGNKLLFDLII